MSSRFEPSRRADTDTPEPAPALPTPRPRPVELTNEERTRKLELVNRLRAERFGKAPIEGTP